jgi:hypothetical protein
MIVMAADRAGKPASLSAPGTGSVMRRAESRLFVRSRLPMSSRQWRSLSAFLLLFFYQSHDCQCHLSQLLRLNNVCNNCMACLGLKNVLVACLQLLHQHARVLCMFWTLYVIVNQSTQDSVVQTLICFQLLSKHQVLKATCGLNII